MIQTLLNWIYIFLTSYTIGFFLIPRLSKLIGTGKEVRPNWCDNVVAGIVTATVYAETFSLFYKVGLAANLIMILCCVLFVFIDRKKIREMIGHRLQMPDGGFAKISCILLCLCAAVVFVFALMYTAEGIFHYDTGLYHAQSIHWLEDYGIIKGLGLIHIRFAYNSAYFPLCALYSLRDIMQGQSLHSMSGFLFALICMYSFFGWQRSIIKKHPENGGSYVISSFIRFAAPLYFIICILNITSPESDYITGNLIIWVFLRLCEIYEEEKDGDDPCAYCLVSICAFALIGYKLSAAVIPLVALWPLVILIRRKQWRSIIVCALLCALTILPYLARNVMICGWTVYPVTQFDFFNVPWKFDKALVEGDAKEIENWARGLHMDGAVDSSFTEWLKYWWSVQYLGTKLFIGSLLLSVPLMIFTFFDKKKWFINYLTAVMAATIAFYMIKAPLIRYCYGPVLIIPLMTAGYVTDLALKRSKAVLAAAVVAVIAVMMPTFVSVKEVLKYDYEQSAGRFSPKDHLFRQIDYPSPEVKQMDWYGYTVYIPVEGDQCWYHAFPSSPYHEAFDNTMPVSGDLRNGVVKRVEKK